MTNIKAETAKLLESEFNISKETTEEMFRKGVLNEQSCRNVLIKEEYKRKAQPKEKIRVRNRIAERYCISVKLVEKLVLK
jgi:hypothetical protein